MTMSSVTYPDLSHILQEDRRIDYHVNVNLSQEEIKADLFNVCNQLFYRYRGHEAMVLGFDQIPETFKHQSLTGGITNRLFVCRYETIIDGELYTFAPLLVRLFGPHTDSVIDRTVELKVAKFISRNSVGPLVLGSFSNGRLEGFLEGARSLTPQQLLDKSISCSVAQAVALLHRLPYHATAAPAQDAAASHDCITESADVQPPTLPRHRSLWVTISNWLSQARAARKHFASTPARLAVYDSLHLDALEREVTELHALLESLEEPVVFCHNDLLSGNILLVPARTQQEYSCGAAEGPIGVCVTPVEPTTPAVKPGTAQTNACGSPPVIEGECVPLAVTLIDFEYGAPNSRAFDIANHFCECCGFACDWTCFPDADHQRAFLRAYMRAYDVGDTPGSPQLRGGAEAVAPGDALFEARVENLRRRVMGFVLASHVFWATWAVVMAVSATIDFDYLSYAALRLRGYYFMKHRALLALQPLLAARSADAHIRSMLMRTLDPAQSVVPPVLGAVLVGWGAAGRSIHAPLIAAAEGVVLRGAVLRTPDQYHETIGKTTPFGDLCSSIIQAPASSVAVGSEHEYLVRARAAQQYLADLNLCLGSTGICVDADAVARTNADVCNSGVAEPLTRASVTTPAHAQWLARRERQWALQRAELEDYEMRVLRAGVDWRGEPIIPAVLRMHRVGATAMPTLTPTLSGLTLSTGASDAESTLIATLGTLCLPREPAAPVIYPSVAAALADPQVHLVVVATPPATHAPIALAAIAAGKHVVVDKPFAVSRDEAETIIAAARAAPRPLLVSCFQNRRWDADYTTLYALVHNGLAPSSYNYVHSSRIATQHPNMSPTAALHAALAPRVDAALAPGLCSGVLGRVRWAELCFQKGLSAKAWKLAPLEQGGGRMWDLGAHSVDQALLLFKPHLPVRVHAHILRDLFDCEGADSHALIAITFSDGSVATVDCGGLNAIPKPRVLVVGDRASVCWDGGDPQEAVLANGQPACSAAERVGSSTCTCALCLTLPQGQPARVVRRPLTHMHPLHTTTVTVAVGALPVACGARVDAYSRLFLQPLEGVAREQAEYSAVLASGRWSAYYALAAAHCLRLEAEHAGTGIARAAACENPVDPLDTLLTMAVLEAAMVSARSGQSEPIKY